jgi:hypothetical protein
LGTPPVFREIPFRVNCFPGGSAVQLPQPARSQVQLGKEENTTMTKLFICSPQNCAFVFNGFVLLFLVHMVCTPIAILWLHWFAFISLPITLSVLCLFGLLAYQIGYHPLMAALWCVGLFIPWANFVFMLVLFFQAKAYLKKQNYRIVLLGARPMPPEDVIADMDLLIKAGKIRMPKPSRDVGQAGG